MLDTTTSTARPDAARLMNRLLSQDDVPAGDAAPHYRTVAIHLTDGLDGVVRVVTVLRGRSYRVRDVRVDVREGVAESRIDATVLLTGAATELLLARLRRMPVVVSAEPG